MTAAFLTDPEWLRLVDEARELEIQHMGKQLEVIQRQIELGDRSPQSLEHRAHILRQRDAAIRSRSARRVGEIEAGIDRAVAGGSIV